jgi:RHS repeat-associated protein
MTSRGPGGLEYFNIAADPATNRMVGKNYDANGNLHHGNWSYDIENRLVSVDTGAGEQYMYDPSNKRIYKQNNRSLANGGGETYYFYGLDGKVVGEYSVGAMSPGQMQLNLSVESAYFGGKKVLPAVARDRLGSVRGNGSGANRPYRENYSSQNTDGFATYYQDAASGLNYADQRYYSAQYGRFNTPDRYVASGGPGIRRVGIAMPT